MLRRVDFGEADRIITFLTPDRGKVGVLARGVRKTKSKLAGGIELFSVSDITVLPGRGEVSTLISARLLRHYGNIVKDLERTKAGYEFIKMLSKATEDNPEAAFFNLIDNTFKSLDQPDINLDLINLWFAAQLLKLSGHSPNLSTDQEGRKLQQHQNYVFDFDAMGFQLEEDGRGDIAANHIKLLRLVFSSNLPKTIQKIQGVEALSSTCRPLINSMLASHIRV